MSRLDDLLHSSFHVPYRPRVTNLSLNLLNQSFGRDQTCAMSLSIAVGESTTYDNSSESNSKYHSLLQPSLGAPGGYHHRWGPETIQQAKKLLVESSGRPEISLSGGNPQGCQFFFR
jgi:hypothetical protein